MGIEAETEGMAEAAHRPDQTVRERVGRSRGVVGGS